MPTTDARPGRDDGRPLDRSARRPPERLLRALQINLDHFRIWSKVTWNRGRILATRGDTWETHDTPAYFDATLSQTGNRSIQAGAAK